MWTNGAHLIKKIKLSKFNGSFCENLYADVCYIKQDRFDDVIDLYHRVNSKMENSNWLKFRDFSYLKNVLDNGGFIVGCYIEDMLVASALCEVPWGDYKNTLVELGMSSDEIDATYISGYVMVDPVYRGNSLHRVLLETRMNSSVIREKKYIVTAIAKENIYSLKTVLDLGFEIKIQRENEYGTIRNILMKELDPIISEDIEITA